MLGISKTLQSFFFFKKKQLKEKSPTKQAKTRINKIHVRIKREDPKSSFSMPSHLKGRVLKNQDSVPPKKIMPAISPAKKDFPAETFSTLRKNNRGNKLKNGKTIKLNGGWLKTSKRPDRIGKNHFNVLRSNFTIKLL